MDASRIRPAAVWLAATFLLGACATDTTDATDATASSSATPTSDATASASAAPTADACSAQVIVALTESTAPEPDAALVADLADTARVRLEYVRSAGPGMHVFALRADDPDPRCAGALDRLRRDPRVRSIELDEHRVRHG